MIANYNPDVLTCLANLSNDEVFTPPNIANQMLDLLPTEIWRDKSATFLDPAAKSGVFLREIAKRLMTGLEKEIPNQQKRIDHVFTKQIFGIGITSMTALLTRRSLYCSKKANGKYSICEGFAAPEGNILFGRVIHIWEGNQCKYCGANIKTYDRDESLETHAYHFIHTDTPEEFFKMKFDVIVGNPPYQLNDGGGMGSSAIPIYHRFVSQAKKLKPRYMTMIIPSRWFTGGRGLDEFRDEMLNDRRIKVIHDFLYAGDCFPGVEIKGGVNYFLWSREEQGDCKIYTHEGNAIISESERPLLEKGAETFIRFNEAVPILHKVGKLNEEKFSEIISANDPFGFDVRVENSYKRIHPKYNMEPFKNSAVLYYNGWRRDGLGFIGKDVIAKNTGWIGKYKVFVPKAWGIGNIGSDWIKPFIGDPNSCCTETYLVVGPFEGKVVAENVISYTQTKFFHFMLALVKITQNTMKKAYSFIPVQNFNEKWSDERLYERYGLNKTEIEFIEKMVCPADNGEDDG